MKTANNTILIIGGSAGIGLEMAKLFAPDNNVIITGRSKERLEKAAASLPNVTTIVSDLGDEADLNKLFKTIADDFPKTNIIINNAAAASVYKLTDDKVNAFDKAATEIHTNYLSIIRLNEKFLPLLRQQDEAAIVNVSSVVALVPGGLSTYSASKAALHSYTQSLRWELEQTYPHIKVFELMPPLINTEFSRPIGGENGIAPHLVAEDLVKGLANDEYEIRVGDTEKIYQLYLSSPEKAFVAMHPLAKQEEHA
jgi:uncharacterized oxidoreductase